MVLDSFLIKMDLGKKKKNILKNEQISCRDYTTALQVGINYEHVVNISLISFLRNCYSTSLHSMPLYTTNIDFTEDGSLVMYWTGFLFPWAQRKEFAMGIFLFVYIVYIGHGVHWTCRPSLSAQFEVKTCFCTWISFLLPSKLHSVIITNILLFLLIFCKVSND